VNAFSPANVAKATARIPQTDSGTLRVWSNRARTQGLVEFAAGCERELAVRPFDMTAKLADTHGAWSESTRELTLQAAIAYAFTELPARAYERSLIRLIATNSGISYPEVVARYGNRDAALVIGVRRVAEAHQIRGLYP